MRQDRHRGEQTELRFKPITRQVAMDGNVVAVGNEELSRLQFQIWETILVRKHVVSRPHDAATACNVGKKARQSSKRLSAISRIGEA
jgi:hypothetical protein